MDERDLAALSDAEQLLVNQLYAGDVADLHGLTVRAAVVRAIVAGPSGPLSEPTSAGAIRIRNATIDGVLDFEGCAVDRPVTLTGVTIETDGTEPEALILRDARLRRVSLQNCHLGAAFCADRCDIRSGLFIGGGRIDGAVQIRGARLGGAFAVEAAHIGDGATAMVGHGCDVDGPAILRKTQFRGVVSFAHAKLRSGVNADCVVCGWTAGCEMPSAAFDLNGARLDGDLLLGDGYLFAGLDLAHAAVSGRIDSSRLHVLANGVAAQGLRVGQSLTLDRALIAGPIDLNGAAIAKCFSGLDLEIEGGEIALSAHVADFGGDVCLSGLQSVGEVRWSGAKVRGNITLDGARIDGGANAIGADGLQLDDARRNRGRADQVSRCAVWSGGAVGGHDAEG